MALGIGQTRQRRLWGPGMSIVPFNVPFAALSPPGDEHVMFSPAPSPSPYIPLGSLFDQVRMVDPPHTDILGWEV